MSTARKKIILVEDEIQAAEIIRDYLEQAHYSVELFMTGEAIVEKVRAEPPNLLILDIMLPGVDGTTICREIRSFSSVPIIMLTARVDEIDRLVGYELGADDYICKPVNPREVLARTKAILRRVEYNEEKVSPNLTLDESGFSAKFYGESLNLTGTEFRLLKMLSDNEGKVFSRKQIMEEIYEQDSEASERSIDTCIKKLRRKISDASDEENPIHSVYGIGYKYETA